MSFKWPTDAEDGRTSLVLDKMVGRPIGIEKNTGPWSLFRLFDLMQTEYLTGRDVLVLKAEVGGLRVWVDFRAPDEAVLEGLALSADYTLRFPASALPTLAVGEIVTVRGASYRVRDLRAIGDGSERRAALTRE